MKFAISIRLKWNEMPQHTVNEFDRFSVVNFRGVNLQSLRAHINVRNLPHYVDDIDDVYDRTRVSNTWECKHVLEIEQKTIKRSAVTDEQISDATGHLIHVPNAISPSAICRTINKRTNERFLHFRWHIYFM